MTFSDIWNKLKEITRRMFGMETTIEQTLHMTPAVSSKMTQAIDDWTAMYQDQAEWLNEPTATDPRKVVSLGLPAFISSEKARMAVIELQSEITAPKKEIEKENPDYFEPYIDPQTGAIRTSGQNKTIVEEVKLSSTERADFMNKEYHKKLLPKIRTQLEYGIAKGSLIIKPYVVKSKIKGVAGINSKSTDEKDKYEFAFDFVQADCFYPFAFDSNGNLIEVAFVQTKTDKDKLYTRLEYHKLKGNHIEIVNTAYETLNNNNTTIANGSAISLGKQIPLTSVFEWKDIPERATIQNVDRLLFGYFKMPDANTIDPHSPLGISGFARAKSLIKEADMQYSRLLWEYEGGEMAIDIDRDALKYSAEDNKSFMTHLQDRLYRTVDLGESNTYNVFAPSLRDASILNGLNAVLMRIEDVCAMSRGTLSDATAEARTATEIRVLKQRSYSSNLEIQKALQQALEDTIYAMDVYCTVYNLVGDIKVKNGEIDAKAIGKYDVSFTWDDSILVDVETELNKRMTLLNAGITSKKEVRMWYYGETARQAQEALDEISAENQQAVEQNAIASSQMGNMIQQAKEGESTQASVDNKQQQNAKAQEQKQKASERVDKQQKQQKQAETEDKALSSSEAQAEA